MVGRDRQARTRYEGCGGRGRAAGIGLVSVAIVMFAANFFGNKGEQLTDEDRAKVNTALATRAINIAADGGLWGPNPRAFTHSLDTSADPDRVSATQEYDITLKAGVDYKRISTETVAASREAVTGGGVVAVSREVAVEHIEADGSRAPYSSFSSNITFVNPDFDKLGFGSAFTRVQLEEFLKDPDTQLSHYSTFRGADAAGRGGYLQLSVDENGRVLSSSRFRDESPAESLKKEAGVS